MDKSFSFEEFLATESVKVPIFGFCLNFLLVMLLSSFLGYLYIRYGTSLSNRRQFASTFVLMGCTTMLVISIVKSSLALSLGLVGALSIVRFRAAIKEPEELIYLFLIIAVGLGLGADQRVPTLLAIGIIATFIIIRGRMRSKNASFAMLYTVSGSRGALNTESLLSILKDTTTFLDLRRIAETGDAIDIAMQVEFSDSEALEGANKRVRTLDPNARISFFDASGDLWR